MNEREKDFIANFCDNGNLCALCNSQRERIDKAIEILKSKDLAPTCRTLKALEILEGK